MTRNKKSIIALIAMALFLVASIALSVTGAYFTAEGAKSISDVSPKWGDVKVTISASDLLVKQNNVEKAATANMIIMPGDQYKGGVFTATITSNDVAGVYAVVKNNTDGKYYAVSGSTIGTTAVTSSSTLTAITGVSSGKTITWGGKSEWTYFGAGTAQTTGQNTSVATAAAGNYTIYVIQASNLTGAQAAAQLCK